MESAASVAVDWLMLLQLGVQMPAAVGLPADTVASSACVFCSVCQSGECFSAFPIQNIQNITVSFPPPKKLNNWAISLHCLKL